MEIPKKIVWLASYPKSGNTWFRAFLTALMNGGEVDLRGLKLDEMFSSRNIIKRYTDLDSNELYEEEIKLIQPEIFNLWAAEAATNQPLFVKVHDAYTYNTAGKPIIPTEATQCAIYFVRNPLDVVSSLAHHLKTDNDFATSFLNDSTATFGGQKKNVNTSRQTRQQLLNWSEHVCSWLDQNNIPVLLVRYEDMYTTPLATFSKIVSFVGLQYTPDDIQKAIKACSFETLKEKELTNGFKEQSLAGNNFFRKGQVGSWLNELTDESAIKIKAKHHKTMLRLKYL